MRSLPTLVVAALVLVPLALPAQAPGNGGLPPLSFLGLPAGASLRQVKQRVDSLGGRVRCDRARGDRAVLECRGILTDPDARVPVELWLSAIDSTAGVMTLSATLSGVDFDRWRQGLTDQFGKVDARVQGAQWMLQWVRRGRMIRLTWRIEGNTKVASVSLVDGHVLDRWGADRAARRPATRREQPAADSAPAPPTPGTAPGSGQR